MVRRGPGRQTMLSFHPIARRGQVADPESSYWASRGDNFILLYFVPAPPTTSNFRPRSRLLPLVDSDKVRYGVTLACNYSVLSWRDFSVFN